MNAGDGDGDGGAATEWKFSQVFGERAAGEEVQEGKDPLVFVSGFNSIVRVSLFDLIYLYFFIFCSGYYFSY